MPMKRHDDAPGWRKRSSRLAVTRPVDHTQDHTPPPPVTLRTEKQLTAPADHGVRDPAHAVAFTTTVAVGGAGSVPCRTGTQTAGALPVDSGRPGSPHATDCQQNPPPALPVNHARVSLTTVAARHPNVRKKEVKMILKEPHARAA